MSSKTSKLMSSVKQRDTTPELKVRFILRSLGHGYRLCRKDLPGRPDIVIGKFRLAIFIHGCFWHGHSCKHGSIKAKTNTEFWDTKIDNNIKRDLRKCTELATLGWRSATVWECETKRDIVLKEKIENILRDYEQSSAEASSAVAPKTLPKL